MFFRRRKIQPRSDGSVFFLFVGILGTVILASVVLGSTLGGRLTIGEQPDLVGLLERSDAPETVADIQQEPVGSAADTRTAFAYTVDGRRRAGLVSWERQLGEYRLLDEVRLDLDGALTVELAEEDAAVRTDGMVVFRVTAGSEVGRAMVWFGVGGSELVSFSVCGPDGGCGQPLVLSDRGRLEFVDLTGDGQSEMMVVRADGQSEVYAWRGGGRLRYDQSLTAAMNAKDTLFPEP